jgi:hypothetical protein
VGWASVIVAAVVLRFACVRATRMMCVKFWEAKWRAVERAMPGPEPMIRRGWGAIGLVLMSGLAVLNAGVVVACLRGWTCA